jgi:hypothetical protein
MENTQNTSPNPLSKYFRQPALYIKLPSNGQYWTPGSLDLPVTGEIPVYPMTARDEITLRTPDALMNGTGVVEVLQSCCPSINNAWHMPSIDVDTVLIAIRVASYGYEMTVDTICPHCQEENSHSVDLRVVLSGVKCPDYNKRVEVNELKIKVKPMEFFSVNKNNSINFEEQRLLANLRDSTLPDDERAAKIRESMNKLVNISIETVAVCVESIELDDGSVVNNPEYIKEFFQNTNGDVLRAVQKRLSEISVEAELPVQNVVCGSCQKDYQVPMEFDYANFFVNGS